MTRISFDIKCGPFTCAEAPGEFCEYMRYSPIKKSVLCHLFGYLRDKEGWVQRHEKCLTAEKLGKPLNQQL